VNSLWISLKKQLRNFQTRVHTFSKFLTTCAIRICTIQFLRKTNTFIKSKYSKNRQWSKVIVYFGLWFGVISVFAITYYTYHFLFIFSYLWWVVGLVVGSICFVSLWKYRRYLTHRCMTNITH
jgi:hypothetical protein